MRRYSLFLRVSFSLVVLFILSIFIDFENFWEVVTGIYLPILIVAFLLNVAGSVLANSLQFFFHVRGEVNSTSCWLLLWQVTKIDFIVRFYSLFMPVGATAAVRWHRFILIGIGALSSGAAILVNKLQQFFLIFLFVGIAFLFHESDVVSQSASFWISVCSLTLSAGLLLLLFGFFFGGYVRQLKWVLDMFLKMRFVSSRPQLTVRLKKYFVSYEDAVVKLSVAEFFNVVIWAFVSFFVVAYSQSLIMQALGVFLPFSDVLFLRGLVFLAMMVPFSIAGIGFREMGTVVGLSLYGVSTEVGLTVGVILFGFQVLISLIGGVLEGLRFIKG